ncbi:MAG TPA: alanine--tRNA ligase-related protein, partial [Gammaproteobacteria bacterium]|nr:alanine--tRNA ligase-related protein [Gammaproteobacteria bacterium]
MTDEIFRRDAYARSCEAQVTAVDDQGVHLDRTVFYPTGGGQPGDRGVLEVITGGEVIRIVDTRKGTGPGEIVHVTEDPVTPALVGK